MKPMACSHGRALNWPKELWIGIEDTTWPVRAFTSADYAAQWVSKEPTIRHAYRVEVVVTATVEYVPPVPETHRVIPYPPGVPES